jgi:hypothetical protein
MEDLSTFNHRNFKKLLAFYEENYTYVEWPEAEEPEEPSPVVESPEGAE